MARAFDECPHCGATFRRGRPACPECGSDAETGWRDAEDLDYLSIELPEPDAPPPPRAGGQRLAVVAVLALVAVLLLVWTVLAW